MKKIKVLKNAEFIDNYKKMNPAEKVAFKKMLNKCQNNLMTPTWKKKLFKK